MVVVTTPIANILFPSGKGDVGRSFAQLQSLSVRKILSASLKSYPPIGGHNMPFDNGLVATTPDRSAETSEQT
jgi:hypothetical protein